MPRRGRGGVLSRGGALSRHGNRGSGVAVRGGSAPARANDVTVVVPAPPRRSKRRVTGMEADQAAPSASVARQVVKRSRREGPDIASSLSEWKKLKQQQLVGLCRLHKLPQSGPKEALARRLVEHNVRLPSEDDLAALAVAPKRGSGAQVAEVADDVVEADNAVNADDVVEADDAVNADEVVDVDELLASASSVEQKAQPALASEVGEVIGHELDAKKVVNPPRKDVLDATDFVMRCIEERTIPASLPLRTREFIASAINQAVTASSLPYHGGRGGAHTVQQQPYSPVRASVVDGEVCSALPKSLEEKVKNGTFVDLALFLPDTSCNEETCHVASFASSGSDDHGRLVLQRGRTRRVETSQAWMEAFLAYAERVCFYRPDLRSDLTSYAALINRLSGRLGFAKIYPYDKRIRTTRAGFIAPWTPIDNTEYLVTVTAGSQSVERVGVVRRPLPQRINAVKPCYKWNEGKQCASTPCRFSHVCRRCLQEGHRVAECPHAITVEIGSAPNGRTVSKRLGPLKPTPATA